MKDLGLKAMLVILLLVIPITLLSVSLAMGSLAFTWPAIFASLLSSVIGVLLGVLFFTQLRRRLNRLKWFGLVGYVLTVLSTIGLSVLFFELQNYIPGFIRERDLCLAFLSSAIALLAQGLDQNNATPSPE